MTIELYNHFRSLASYRVLIPDALVPTFIGASNELRGRMSRCG